MSPKDDFDPYCKVCGGCGYIGCDGVKGFLEKHVRGKTDCDNEAQFIDDIISEFDNHRTDHGTGH